MELAIPLVALGGLYIISNQSKNPENFSQRQTPKYEAALPNTNVPDKNYPKEYPYNGVNNAETDLTSKLSTVNLFDSPQVYTDKFFNPNVNHSVVNPGAMQNSSVNQGSTQTTGGSSNAPSRSFYSMTGEKVEQSYFQHNNMVPFFGSHSRTNHSDANSNESLIDSYTGSGSQIISKRESAPLFNPSENYQWAHGMPSNTDFIRSRINPSMSMANIKPFPEQKVGPGLAAGYGTEGVGGYNSGLIARDYYREKTVDELRVDNKPKAGGIGLYGHEGPSVSYIPNVASVDTIGRVEKNRVDTTFAMGQDRLFTTMGIESAPTSRALTIEKNMSRTDTLAPYTGAAGNSTSSQLIDGEYMPSKHIDLGTLPLGVAGANGYNGPNTGDYGIKSQMAYPNNRTQNPRDDYFGAVGGAIGAAVAPLLDMLRPSRRENTIGTLRPYQNPGSTVSQSYLFNPADVPQHTIRETTENSSGHLYINANQRGDGYKTAPQDVKNTMRQETADYLYMGNSSANEGTRQFRNYDAEYNQRNNEVRQTTLKGHTPSGGMALLNGDINQTTNGTREQDMKYNRALNPSMPYQIPSIQSMGQNTEMQNTLYSGIQVDRNSADIFTQLKGNPYVLSHINGL